MTLPTSVVETPRQKALRIFRASTRASTPANPLNKLPTELLVLIARFYFSSSDCDDDNYFPVVVLPLTHVNRRLRQIIVGVSDLWASFGISDAEGSFRLARLCIERSNLHPFKIRLCIFMLENDNDKDLRDRFYDVLNPVASRIRVLNVYMTEQRELNIGKSVLARLKMPTLEELGLHYDGICNIGPIPGIEGGGNLQALTLKGLFPTDSALSNLKSLTLVSVAYWTWSPSLISTFVMGSPSLESLTLEGADTSSEVGNPGKPFVISCPSLLSLAMTFDISSDFTSTFLLGVHAPNLRAVHVTTPSSPGYGRSSRSQVDWMRVIARIEEGSAKGTLMFEKVRSLTVDLGVCDGGPQRNRGFFRFLRVVFPWITSLELHQTHIEVLSLCAEEKKLLQGSWGLLTKLTINGDLSYFTLGYLLAFIHVRNGKGLNYWEEDEEKGREDAGHEEHDHHTESGSDEAEEDQEEETEGGSGGDGGYGGAQIEGRHEANEAIRAWVDEDQGDVAFMPIETVVIRSRRTSETVMNTDVSRLREKVKSVQVLQSIGLAPGDLGTGNRLF
ncbi:hypothetical protein M407DRAFT_26296 [Tulasnella calospora MUT 4182]|uniref:F-box domain-containing protein n=1 Tax=Tulasnella calospora MUT 4182 TaxID=1051891 RepID=A0A0C3QEH2_9AGAM|nr:hypothetical protein M407DRAFT_26296 [Tulasnella calospora MUT 4182]